MVSIPVIILLVLAGLIIIAGLWLMTSYNGLVTLRQSVKNAWAQIDVQLKRRHDLIPNLVNTVKGYAAHEKETFGRVINARAGATSATSAGEARKAEGAVSWARTGLLAGSEASAELKANQTFMALQE